MVTRLVVFLAPLLLHASAPRAAVASKPGAVLMLVQRGDEGVMTPLLHAAQSQLIDLGLTLTLTPIPELPADSRAQAALARTLAQERAAAAATWVEASAAETLRVSVLEPVTGAFYTREVGLHAGGAEGRLEAAAYIIRTAIRALVIDIPPEAIPPSAPQGDRLTAALAYAAGPFAIEQPARHGVWARLGVVVTPRFGAEVSYRRHLETTGNTPATMLRFKEQSLQAGASWRLRVEPWAFELGVAALASHLRWDLAPTRSSIVALSRSSRWTVGVAPTVRVSRILGRAAIFAALACDTLWDERRLVMSTRDGEETLLRPYWLRPWAALGLEVAIL